MGSHNARKLTNAWIHVLEGPEDDLLGRNMSPWHVYLCIQNKCVNWLTMIIYLYIVTLRDGKLWKYINEITLLHQVGISNYIMRMMHGQTTLKFEVLIVFFKKNIKFRSRQWFIKKCDGRNEYCLQNRLFTKRKVTETWIVYKKFEREAMNIIEMK